MTTSSTKTPMIRHNVDRFLPRPERPRATAQLQLLCLSGGETSPVAKHQTAVILTRKLSPNWVSLLTQDCDAILLPWFGRGKWEAMLVTTPLWQGEGVEVMKRGVRKTVRPAETYMGYSEVGQIVLGDLAHPPKYPGDMLASPSLHIGTWRACRPNLLRAWQKELVSATWNRDLGLQQQGVTLSGQGFWEIPLIYLCAHPLPLYDCNDSNRNIIHHVLFPIPDLPLFVDGGSECTCWSWMQINFLF